MTFSDLRKVFISQICLDHAGGGKNN